MMGWMQEERKWMMLEFWKIKLLPSGEIFDYCWRKKICCWMWEFRKWSLIYTLCDLWHDELTHCEEPCETEISLWMPERGDYGWRVVEPIKIENLSKNDFEDADLVGWWSKDFKILFASRKWNRGKWLQQLSAILTWVSRPQQLLPCLPW